MINWFRKLLRKGSDEPEQPHTATKEPKGRVRLGIRKHTQHGAFGKPRWQR